MIVCICENVTDSEIVERHLSGEELGVGMRCCKFEVQEIIESIDSGEYQLSIDSRSLKDAWT